MIGLIHTATVYVRDGSGNYMSVAKSGLACRAVHPKGGESLPARAELAASRVLMWGPEYEFPSKFIQVEIDSERWNIRPETIAELPGPSGAIEYRRAMMVRAGS